MAISESHPLFGMNIMRGVTLALALISALPTMAQNTRPVDAKPPLDLAFEENVVATARGAMRGDDDNRADQALVARGPNMESVSAETLARRAAAVCGWLQNDNQHARAYRVARRTVQQLATMTDADDAERLERLYWEAWLEGYVLDRKLRALELLDAARALAPDDPRILADAQKWAEAMAEFGR